MSAEWPSVLDALKSLQSHRNPTTRRWTPESRVGFALSTRDRFVYTMRTIKSLDAEGGCDLIWNDGSECTEVPELSRYFAFRNARLVEVNYGVKGGADAAIRFGLRRLLELGYDFIGLIENDLLLAPGWLGAMRGRLTQRRKMASRSEQCPRSDIKVACCSIEKTIPSIGRAGRRWCFLPARPRSFCWRTTLAWK